MESTSDANIILSFWGFVSFALSHFFKLWATLDQARDTFQRLLVLFSLSSLEELSNKKGL